ncbi:MAG: helix-turn-helix domain-containing protein [Paludibacteraceae bacterium]|nr:helix-turn-helix domain-containing protein [Paludibacteraceae bacterium]
MIRTFSDMILADNLDEVNGSPEQMSEYLILLYCEQGELQLTLDNTQYTMHPGNILMCMPQSLIGHYLRTPDFQAKVLAVGKHFFDNVLSDCFEIEPNWWQKAQFVRNHPVWTVSDYQTRLIQAYYQLITVYAEDEATPYRQRIIRAMAQAAAYEILAILEQAIVKDTSPDTANTMPGAKDHILLQFMQLLNRPGNTQRDVQSYAHQLLISPKYLTAVCKEKTNRTASDWINQIISGHIRHYLTYTRLSIKEIAYQMDFPDVSFFCKYTRKHLGCSPMDYRRMVKQDAFNS